MPRNIFLLFIVATYHCNNGQIQFKQNAADFITAGFSRGRSGERVNELSITVNHRDIFENGESITTVDNLVVEVKSGVEGCWKRVEEKPARRGREKLMWRVKIVPCQAHNVRIGVRRQDCVDYFFLPKTVGPATSEQISNSHFRPSGPTGLTVTSLSETSVNLTWSQSHCAESYDIWYESLDSSSETPARNKSVSTDFAIIDGLNNCTEYALYVTATVGDEFSDEAEIEFNTCNIDGISSGPQVITDFDSVCGPVDKVCETKDRASTTLAGDEDLSLRMHRNVEETKDELISTLEPEPEKGNAGLTFASIILTVVPQILLQIILM